MQKVTITITNSVNDDENEIIKVCKSDKSKGKFITKYQDEVDEWNKPDYSPGGGGKMSTRYIDIDTVDVNDDMSIEGLTLKDVTKVMKYNKQRKKKLKLNIKDKS